MFLKQLSRNHDKCQRSEGRQRVRKQTLTHLAKLAFRGHSTIIYLKLGQLG